MRATKYKYDPRGNQIELILEDEHHRTAMRTVTKFDEHNNGIKVTNYEPSGKVNSNSGNSYVYDTHGNWIENTYYDEGRPVYVIKRLIQYY
jgi:hypothetical protein